MRRHSIWTNNKRLFADCYTFWLLQWCFRFQIDHRSRTFPISSTARTTGHRLGFERDYNYRTAFRAVKSSCIRSIARFSQFLDKIEHFRVLSVSLQNQLFVRNHSFDLESPLQVYFYVTKTHLCKGTRFETEAGGNTEMGYCNISIVQLFPERLSVHAATLKGIVSSFNFTVSSLQHFGTFWENEMRRLNRTALRMTSSVSSSQALILFFHAVAQNQNLSPYF